MFLYLADFLKTNRMKFVVILVKRRRKAGFWGVISFKITLTKERKGKEKRKEAMVALNAIVTLSIFAVATLEVAFGR